MMKKKVFHPCNPHKRAPNLKDRHPCRLRLHSPIFGASYTVLAPYFLQPQPALPHTAVVIVLDWTQPWTFLEELHTWLTWVECWFQGDCARELEVICEENREGCKSQLIFILYDV